MSCSKCIHRQMKITFPVCSMMLFRLFMASAEWRPHSWWWLLSLLSRAVFFFQKALVNTNLKVITCFALFPCPIWHRKGNTWTGAVICFCVLEWREHRAMQDSPQDWEKKEKLISVNGCQEKYEFVSYWKATGEMPNAFSISHYLTWGRDVPLDLCLFVNNST
jgi:hypothetical protein